MMRQFILLSLMDTLVLLSWTYALRIHPRSRHWSTIAVLWVLKLGSNIPLLYGREIAIWMDWLSLVIFLWLVLDNNDKGKRLWGKIRSAALTAVNQASFRNQQKEAFS